MPVAEGHPDDGRARLPARSAGERRFHARRERLDAAFISLPVVPADLDARLLATASLALFVPGAHPLAGAGEVALTELAEFPFIDSPPGFGNRMMVDQALAESGVEREVTVEMADIRMAAISFPPASASAF